jgi:hypothetical protein
MAFVGAQNKTGSVYYDLDVPDFIARPLSLSGVLLTSDPKPVPLPLRTLAPGEYLLTVEAASGRGTARRDVRFVVR